MAKRKKNNGSVYPQFEGLGLNAQQEEFVVTYCRPDFNFNGTRAYGQVYGIDLDAEYNTAQVNASRLLSNAMVMRAVDIERNRRAESHEDLARFVLNEWYKMANVSITDLLNITGPIVMVKDLAEIPAHLHSCIETIKTTSNGVEVKLRDRDKALENMAKALGMFVDKTQNLNEDYETLVEKISRERREARAKETQGDASE